MQPDKNYALSRRKFTLSLGRAVGTSAFLSVPMLSATAKAVSALEGKTVGEVIAMILQTIPGAPFKETVDTLKSGSAEQQVSGIVSTTFATVEVIEKAIALGANFIIVHEPTFYNHLDETAWLAGHEVYQYKKELLDKHRIAVWRFHDYWHTHQPDGIRTGVLNALQWQQYAQEDTPYLLTLPATPLKEIVAHVKEKLGIPMVRVMGDPARSCLSVALMPGASGGRRQIEVLQQTRPDLLICGELSEWETSEYIRDARQMGRQLSLIILGHAVSEEPGMEWLVTWLQPKVPDIKVTHIPAQNPFSWM